jgi:hypothetical protein
MKSWGTKKTVWSAWSEACFDCAVKRGLTKKIQSLPFPFMCVHRTDLQGCQKACAGDREKTEKFASEQFKLPGWRGT